ncbi:ribonuclease E inhibitor RraB [Sulfurimonas sp. ST-27]|uniref:ribonuclease E inhibitor RraB n=1 Tax=Sulfurimonas sp. ST-27 TaxID=3400152 RepID=UPI003AB23ED4
MREIFIRNEDGKKVFIEVDLHAYGYSNKYGWLLSVFIKFDALDESAEGFEEYLDVKESLIIALEHDDKAKYVGSRVVDGWSELYFYALDSKGSDAIVANILKDANYIYESSVVRDTKWDFHYKNLAPNELELCHIESEKIIFLLEEEGDDPEIPRAVEHYVSFYTPTQKNKFLNSLSLEGFSFKDEISSEEFENGVALLKIHAVTREEVKKVVNELFEAIKKEQGYYEGWSTLLAQEENV